MNEDIDVLMEEYQLLNDAIRNLKSKKENLKTRFLIYLKTEEVDRYDGNAFVLKYSKYTRKTLNKDRLITSIGQEEYDHYLEESEYERLTIKKKEDNKNDGE